MRFISLLLTAFMLVACSQDEDIVPQKEIVDLGHDYFSFANSDQFDTSHIALDLTVDFELKELRGLVTLNMQRLDPAATDIILDTRDLHIDGILVEGSEAAFEYSEHDPVLGQALKITLPEGLEQQTDLVVTIHYKTDPSASALQWLPPQLTAGGKHPYMFSQSQSIHARSWHTIGAHHL
jgi:aminopeptidase N